MGGGGSKKRVCIIGAGPSGLVALKEFSRNTEVFDVSCLEQASDVGGVWNYSDSANFSATVKRTSVYKNLKVNHPKEFYAFSDLPFEDHTPSFPHHSEIKKYLSNYAQTHKLQKLIKFNTRVTSVQPKKQDGREVWQVETVNMQNKKTDSTQFDILIVCSGANAQAHIPSIKGLKDFKGIRIHSQEYREPSAFKNKRVVVVGGGPAAVEISLDVMQQAKKVYLSHKLQESINIPDSIEQIGEIIEFTKKGMICKKNGALEKNELSRDESEKKNNSGKQSSSESSGSEDEIKKNVSGKFDDIVRKLSRGLSMNEDKKDSKDTSSNNSDSENEEKENGDKENKSETESWSTVVKKKKKTNKNNITESSENEENKQNQQNANKNMEKDVEENVENIVVDQIDVVIFCSGYDYSFSFLSADCGVAVISDKVVGPLYKDMICVGKQTLSFVGLNTCTTSLLFETQAKFLRAFYEEKIKIPSYGSELLSILRKDENKKKSKKIDVVHKPLQMNFYQWKYMKELASIAGFEPVEEKYEKLFRESSDLAFKDYATYRETNFVLGSDGFYEAKINEENVENESEK